MKKFSEIMADWFLFFDKMEVGQTVDIKAVGKRDPELFIDMCKTYIDDSHNDYEFSNDYSTFRRILPMV